MKLLVGMGIVAVAAFIAVLYSTKYWDRPTTTITTQELIHKFKPKLKPNYSVKFSQRFQGTANAYANAHNLPKLSQTECLPGGKGAYGCSFMLKGKCRLAFAAIKDHQITVQNAGIVPLAKQYCHVRTVFKDAGGND